MKKALLKRITAAVCAAATVAALSITASARDFDLPNTKYFSEDVYMYESSYAHMSMPTTNGSIILVSDYSVSGDKYSLTTHYACPRNNFEYRFAYAYVRDVNGNSLWENHKYSDQDKATAVYTALYNGKFNNKIAYTESLGLCSTTYANPEIGINADLSMDCIFNFK